MTVQFYGILEKRALVLLDVIKREVLIENTGLNQKLITWLHLINTVFHLKY